MVANEQKEVRVEVTKHQNAAIREDNIAGAHAAAAIQAEIAGLEAEIAAKQRLIASRQESIALMVNTHKRFTDAIVRDAIVRDAGSDPGTVEKYRVEDKDGKHFLVLTLKPGPEPPPEELQKQKDAALKQGE